MDFGTFKNKMRLSEVKHEEVISILLSHFGNLSSARLPGEYVFENRDKQDSKLILGLDRKGKIVSVQSENISDKEFGRIAEIIANNLIKDQTDKIAQAVLFSTNLKFEGYFRYKDEFQILAIPLEAPHEDQIIGDHPLLIQFVYKSSPNSLIDIARKKEKEIMLARLLSFFTKGYIKHWPFFSSSTWVFEKELVNGDIISRFAQEGYYWTGQKVFAGIFSSVEGLTPIDIVKPQLYYGNLPSDNQKDHCLLLPENLTDLINRANTLQGHDREKFERAYSWFYHSHQIWHQSHSSSFIALVTAIESLFEHPAKCPVCSNPIEEALEHCDTCRQPMYKITKTLKEFLEKYVPFIQDMKNEQKVIYSTRSNLAHGLSMFSVDIEPGLFLRPEQQDQSALQRNIQYIVFVALYNWLLSR